MDSSQLMYLRLVLENLILQKSLRPLIPPAEIDFGDVTATNLRHFGSLSVVWSPNNDL